MGLMGLGNWADRNLILWSRGWLELCLELRFHLRALLDPDLAKDGAKPLPQVYSVFPAFPSDEDFVRLLKS